MNISTQQIAEYENNLRNLQGTLAVEGMTISEDARKDLDRIALEGVSYTTVIAELIEKYAQR